MINVNLPRPKSSVVYINMTQAQYNALPDNPPLPDSTTEWAQCVGKEWKSPVIDAMTCTTVPRVGEIYFDSKTGTYGRRFFHVRFISDPNIIHMTQAQYDALPDTAPRKARSLMEWLGIRGKFWKAIGTISTGQPRVGEVFFNADTGTFCERYFTVSIIPEDQIPQAFEFRTVESYADIVNCLLKGFSVAPEGRRAYSSPELRRYKGPYSWAGWSSHGSFWDSPFMWASKDERVAEITRQETLKGMEAARSDDQVDAAQGAFNASCANTQPESGVVIDDFNFDDCVVDLNFAVSHMLLFAERKNEMKETDRETMKRHADDMIHVGHAILEKLNQQ